MGKWVSFKEALPPDENVYILLLNKDVMQPDIQKSFVLLQHLKEDAIRKRKNFFTHWMPIEQAEEVCVD